MRGEVGLEEAGGDFTGNSGGDGFYEEGDGGGLDF